MRRFHFNHYALCEPAGEKPGTGSGADPTAALVAQLKGAMVDEFSAFEAKLDAKYGAGKKATSHLGGIPGGAEERPAIKGKDAADGTGIHLARIAMARWAEKATRSGDAVSILKARGYEGTAKILADGILAQKAATSTSSNRYESMGLFIEEKVSDEMFELLRPKVWVRQHARQAPLIGSLRFKRQTSTSSSTYTGESEAIEQTKAPDYGEDIMQERSLTTLVSFPNRLLQTVGAKAEQFVRDDLLASKARKENLSFYRGSGTNGVPKGIRTRALDAHVFKAAQAGGEATLNEVRKAKAKLLLMLEEKDAPMANMRWVMSPRVKHFLANLSDGNGNAVYEAQINSGTWGGLGFDCSTQVPNSLSDGGDSNLSELGLIDYSEVIIGQGDMFMDFFPDATIETGGTVRSGVSRNESVLRLIDYHDLITRHPESFAFAKVKWGN